MRRNETEEEKKLRLAKRRERDRARASQLARPLVLRSTLLVLLVGGGGGGLQNILDWEVINVPSWLECP